METEQGPTEAPPTENNTEQKDVEMKEEKDKAEKKVSQCVVQFDNCELIGNIHWLKLEFISDHY